MIYALKKGDLVLQVESLGAQMMSLTYQGRETLWQREASIWNESAPTLFPFIARLYQKAYTYKGKTYPMTLHGFAYAKEFSVVRCSDTELSLELKDSPETLAVYPFPFLLRITFTLTENSVRILYEVENRGENAMYFAVGAHPGFALPFEEGEGFEDAVLEWDPPCRPTLIDFTDSLLRSGKEEEYPLAEEKYLPLRHELFDRDALVFRGISRSVTLYSRVSGHSITVSYPNMPYLGIWQLPHSRAGYVCIEPWSSLPGRDGVVETLEKKEDLICLEKGAVYESPVTVTFQRRKV